MKWKQLIQCETTARQWNPRVREKSEKVKNLCKPNAMQATLVIAEAPPNLCNKWKQTGLKANRRQPSFYLCFRSIDTKTVFWGNFRGNVYVIIVIITKWGNKIYYASWRGEIKEQPEHSVITSLFKLFELSFTFCKSPWCCIDCFLSENIKPDNWWWQRNLYCRCWWCSSRWRA